MRLFRSKQKAGAVDFSNLPRHIAIIMDGNGRWAQRNGLPRTAGHAAGAETFRRVATYCKDIGIEYLTVYAFSTENWKRPAQEVQSIMRLLEKYLREAIEKMEKDRVKMKFFGDISILSEELQRLIEETAEISQRYEGCQVNICVNYGGRDEIVRAARQCAEELLKGGKKQIEMEDFEKHLYSSGIPDPDLIIRPGGEQRLSNFLLYQSAYAELYFTDTLWPDFTEKEINKAIAELQRRNRRFGDIK
ncbi:MAG: polyprenyl diphosphate synthase [Oscillospiraceae bacterium]|jgi:undecaprenyl diphosphate synthase